MNSTEDFYSTKPREQVGRDTFLRYRAQIRAAALAALEILEGGEVDRVFCDYHDDFVIGKKVCGKQQYEFFQVKTRAKTSKNWTLNEVFGLKTQKNASHSAENVKASFAGKLLQHTVTFPDVCAKIVFMTNAHLDETLEAMSVSLERNDVANKYLRFIVDNFNDCFVLTEPKLSEAQILEKLSKLRFESDISFIKDKNNSFESDARTKIYQFSEIDLEFNEARQILVNLLELMSKKTSGIISVFDEATINCKASVDINDLLDLLSISREAYHSLVQGGDARAIKSASVIQRTMFASGASSEEIEYSSRCKTEWDVWLRDNRNKLSDFDLLSIASKIDALLSDALNGTKSFRLGALHPKLKQLMVDLDNLGLVYDLTPPLLFGGFISALVRCKS